MTSYPNAISPPAVIGVVCESINSNALKRRGRCGIISNIDKTMPAGTCTKEIEDALAIGKGLTPREYESAMEKFTKRHSVTTTPKQKAEYEAELRKYEESRRVRKAGEAS